MWCVVVFAINISWFIIILDTHTHTGVLILNLYVHHNRICYLHRDSHPQVLFDDQQWHWHQNSFLHYTSTLLGGFFFFFTYVSHDSHTLIEVGMYSSASSHSLMVILSLILLSDQVSGPADSEESKLLSFSSLSDLENLISSLIWFFSR